MLGRNGVGKTTLIDRAGRRGRAKRPRHVLAATISLACLARGAPLAGIGWCPQERNIFRSLSVEENLTARDPGAMDVERVFDMFPRLRAPRQHGRPALRRRAADAGDRPRPGARPKLLLLDEPTEGCAGDRRRSAGRAARLAAEGLSMIVVEQKPKILPSPTRRSSSTAARSSPRVERGAVRRSSARCNASDRSGLSGKRPPPAPLLSPSGSPLIARSRVRAGRLGRWRRVHSCTVRTLDS